MPTVAAIAAFLEQLAPCRLAEDWDNVGLLVGRRDQPVTKLMTCLTITPASAAEAVEAGADLIVTHHPLPFAATKRLTEETTPSRLLLDLIEARVAVYSAHTAFDSASQGINQRLAEGLELNEIEPLLPREENNGDGGCFRHPPSLISDVVAENVLHPLPIEGAGRIGQFETPTTLGELARHIKQFLNIEHLQMVGDPAKPVRTLAIGCGAAGEFIDAARQRGCDAMLIGETRFHTCLEAEAAGIGLLLPGHFASERFALECLADVLANQFPNIEVWPSRQERDPLRWA